VKAMIVIEDSDGNQHGWMLEDPDLRVNETWSLVRSTRTGGTVFDLHIEGSGRRIDRVVDGEPVFAETAFELAAPNRQTNPRRQLPEGGIHRGGL
jgi:hypothetical protein